MPRIGHYNRALRLFGYLKYSTKARKFFNPIPFDLSGIKFENQDWKDLYPDAQESLPDVVPEPRNKNPVQITAYMDASHADDVLTRRSVTGYVIFIGQATDKWYSKR